MAIPASQRTVAETYDRIRRRLLTLKQQAPAWEAEAAQGLPVRRVLHLVDWLRPALTELPASSNFPQPWIDALAAWANTQNPGAQRTAVEWVAEYDAAGDAARAAFAAAVAALPVDADGYLRQHTVDALGQTTEATVSAATLATVRAALVTAEAAIG